MTPILTGMIAAVIVAAPQDAGPLRKDYEALNARLLAGPTATGVLQAWCDEHGVGDKVRAEVDRGAMREPSFETLARLALKPGETIAYRRVRLACGRWALSEAENWYVPNRLTPEMNATLAGGDTPFGAAIASLTPRREKLGVELLWVEGAPLPVDIFRHRALVSDRDGRPLAEVAETYKADALRLSY